MAVIVLMDCVVIHAHEASFVCPVQGLKDTSSTRGAFKEKVEEATLGFVGLMFIYHQHMPSVSPQTPLQGGGSFSMDFFSQSKPGAERASGWSSFQHIRDGSLNI